MILPTNILAPEPVTPGAAEKNAAENTSSVIAPPDIPGMERHASPALFSDNVPVTQRTAKSEISLTVMGLVPVVKFQVKIRLGLLFTLEITMVKHVVGQ